REHAVRAHLEDREAPGRVLVGARKRERELADPRRQRSDRHAAILAVCAGGVCYGVDGVSTASGSFPWSSYISFWSTTETARAPSASNLNWRSQPKTSPGHFG